MLRIGIVAGEASGDQLGASLIKAVSKRIPNVRFEGIAGPKMIDAGCKAFAEMERLSVMGFVDVAVRVPELLKLRREIGDKLCENPPDIFVGIDAPEFNLVLEERLRKAGIAVVHYVSPTVWAWRRYRIHRIARACDLMLTLLPFELDIYRQHGVPALFVGHPLADEIPLEPDRISARRQLDLPEAAEIIAILPGSRRQEWRHHAEIFLHTARWCLQRRPNLQFVIPLVNQAARAVIEHALSKFSVKLPLILVDGHAHEVMSAANLVLAVSGTATLESMLLKRPAVIAYRASWFNYWIARALINVPWIGLPNLIAQRELMPEFIQSDVRPENLGKPLLDWLESPENVRDLQEEFTRLHINLRRGASDRAAEAILQLCRQADEGAVT
jgi:lipid-A-disaccharide synthase